jgi:endonuclease G, mitochondrial
MQLAERCMAIGIMRTDILKVDPATAAAATAEVERTRNKNPRELASEEVKQDRKQFLGQSLADTRKPAEIESIYERVLGGNDLMPVAYLERGAIAARAVARIALDGGGYGTGFLIAPRVLITNNHVIGNKETAARAMANFRYEVNLKDVVAEEVTVELVPDELFHTSPVDQLDFTVVAISPKVSLRQFGFLPLIKDTGKTAEGEWLTIIQHPSGQRKQLCVRENKFVKRTDNMLWYTTDTEPGSSGSPVFNNDWFVVALHHSGVQETKDGMAVLQPNGEPKWIANEGVRVSRIVETLLGALPNHPLLTPMYSLTPAQARISEPPDMAPLTLPPATPSRPSSPRESTMPESRIISFRVTEDGQVIPLPSGARTESFGGGLSAEDRDLLEKAKAKKKKEAKFDAPFNSDYTTRKGYDPKFLGGGDKIVGFPKCSDALEAEVAPLLKPTKDNKFYLHYINYSVVMHKTRRFAIYSAANVTFAKRFEMSRPPDVWRTDPRIKAEHQVGAFYYKHNQFDRGHLTRREDLEYGDTPKDALGSAGDTCHYTNSTPQHAQFNQNKEIWQGIERHVLEDAIVDERFNAQIITGSVFDEGDPKYRDIKYPLQYWKIVAAINSKDELFATAFLASQEEVIDQFGIEVTEVPIGPFKTFQTKISEIERLTQLKFVSGAAGTTSLSKADPLEKPGVKPKKKKKSAFESTTGVVLPDHYREINDPDEIIGVP